MRERRCDIMNRSSGIKHRHRDAAQFNRSPWKTLTRSLAFSFPPIFTISISLSVRKQVRAPGFRTNVRSLWRERKRGRDREREKGGGGGRKIEQIRKGNKKREKKIRSRNYNNEIYFPLHSKHKGNCLNGEVWSNK